MARLPGFTTWVRRQAKRDDPVGDVGRVALQSDWPLQAWKLEHFAAHLRGHGFRGAQKALRLAWREYHAWTEERS